MSKAVLHFSCSPRKCDPATQTSRCSLRNFHWACWWVVFSKYLQTTSSAVTGGVPGHIWSSLQLTPHCTRRRGVVGVEGWNGGILARRTEPRELFTLGDKHLLPHATITRLGRPHVSDWELLSRPEIGRRYSRLSPKWCGQQSALCYLNWQSNFNWHSDYHTQITAFPPASPHPPTVPLPSSMQYNQSWCVRFAGSEDGNENPLCHLVKMLKGLVSFLIFFISWFKFESCSALYVETMRNWFMLGVSKKEIRPSLSGPFLILSSRLIALLRLMSGLYPAVFVGGCRVIFMPSSWKILCNVRTWGGLHKRRNLDYSSV